MVAPCPPHDTILVVDDNDVSRKALARLLRDAGYTVLEAALGRDALHFLAQHLDLVVLDVILPDIDGFEVCRRIRAAPETAAVPVLMLSGVAVAAGDRVHGLETGADAYLPKPVEPEEFVAHARALLRVRHAEEALRRSEERYRALAESVPHLVWVTGPDGEAEYVNGRWQEYTGLPQSAALGRGWQNMVHPDDLPATLDLWGASLRTGHPFEAEYRLRQADGAYRWHVGRALAMCDRSGKTTRWFGTCTDIDDHRRLERQYLQAQKLDAVGRLAGGVAHDFNNLLTVINGYAELLVRAPLDGPTVRDMAGEVLRAGERGAALVRQLLTFSRQEVVARRPLDLNALVEGMGKLLRRVIGDDVELTTHLQSGLPPVMADPGQLEQVVLNLAVNARDAMPDGGRLTIETWGAELDEAHAPGVKSGPYVLMQVTDTGVGMTEEIRRRAFEPFYTTKEVGRGTGLGLATVYGIVRQTGGHVEVESEPGRGAAFRIYLPTSSEPVKPKSDPGPGAPPRGSETILLVEDAAAVRSFAAGILRDCGYTVLEAGRGDDALTVADTHVGPIQLLVTDVMMPGLSGPEVADRLRARRPELRTLFISGHAGDAARTGMVATAANFLPKPFKAIDLA
ncbi:MAG TPA: response regulator, partial [Gemmataceae bacterium]